ncbi:MAG: hypothetical protein HYY91_07130 [Candidatus Omnitrophica bacterium]|nr:hypothetical protein [Candidatus Omnitrophota bacterium]
MTSLRVKLSVGIGLLAIVSLGVSVALWRTAHRGAATAGRAIALSRFVEELQALDPALVKLTAVAELVARGDGAFRDDLARQVRAVDDLLAGLARQASGLSATQWGLLNHLQQEWKSAQPAMAQLPQSVENMQRSLAVLRQDSVRALQQDASAAAAWPRRVGIRSAVLVAGVVGLTLLISLPWALAVQRLSRQLEQAAERLARGEFTYHLERPSDDALGGLAEAVNAATDSLRRAQGEPTTLLRQEHQLEERGRQLTALQERLRHVERAHEAVQADARQLRQTLEDKTRELAALQRTLTSLESERGKLQAELAHHQGALAQTQQALASTQDGLSSTQSELQWAQQTIVQLTTAREALQADSAAVRKDFEQTRQELAQTQARLTTAQASLAALQSELQQAQAEAQEFRRAVTEKADALAQAQQDAAQLTSRCEALQAKLEQRQKESQPIEASLKTVKDELAAAQKDIQQLTGALAEKTQALAEAQQAISKLQGRLGKQQAELTRRQEEVAKLQTSLSTTRSPS